MRRFHISQISASGPNVKPSTVSFKDGVNFIVGPSNTGKSYIISCIDFMFGSTETPFSKGDTGYETISMTLMSDDELELTATRKIEDGNKGERGANIVEVDTTIPEIKRTEYRISNNEYSDLLLSLMGIDSKVNIINSQNAEAVSLKIRTIFHFFFISESDIFKKSTAFDNPGSSKITASLTSLLYMINGDDLNRYLPEVSADEIKKRETQKDGVLNYLQNKFNDLGEKKKIIEEATAENEDVDYEEEINKFVTEIEEVEGKIVTASNESKKILKQIYDLNKKLQEALYLSNSYKNLHTQYLSDIKRLDFIVEGETKGGKLQHLPNCPFCGHDLDKETDDQLSNVESAKVELARIKLQLEDLEKTESDITNDIKKIKEKLASLNVDNDNIKKLIRLELQPRASELHEAVEKYKQILQMRQSLQLISLMSEDLSKDFFEKMNEEEEIIQRFDAREVFDKDIWKALSNQLNQMIKECEYTGKPESILNIETADVVVGSRHKKDLGKGYRAFLNTLMLFNLMKYLETFGKYALHLLVLDSPILSLREKDYKISENEKAPIGMRQSLIQYIIDNCGKNQVIIAENELPKNVDYSQAHQITFSMEEGEGLRYGFLESVRN